MRKFDDNIIHDIILQYVDDEITEEELAEIWEIIYENIHTFDEIYELEDFVENLVYDVLYNKGDLLC
jgi:hypothetical protein